MKIFNGVVVFLALLLGYSAGAQTRTDDFDGAAVRVEVVQAWPLADGGCSARWCGSVTSSDGGLTQYECTFAVDLKATVNVNRCNGLAGAGANRVLRALRFDVDAGGQ